MKKLLCLLSIVILLVGLIIGPGYYLYCRFLSGKSVGEHLLYERDVTSVAVAGHGVTTSGKGQWKTPITLELTPEMNPIGFNVKAIIGKISFTRQRMVSNYSAILKNEGAVVWEESLSVVKRNKKKDTKSTIKLGGRDTMTVPLTTFSVENAGSYQLTFEQMKDELHISELTLMVRRNVLVPNMGIIITGISMLLVGIIVLFVTSRKSNNTEN